MKLLRYGPKGCEKPGLLDHDNRVRDLSGVIADIAGDALLPEGLERLHGLDPTSLPLVEGRPQQSLRLGPCVGHVGKFMAIGLNYADHAEGSDLPVPGEPVVFSKWTSCISGPDDDVIVPAHSRCTDWEVELGIVIGRGGYRIPAAEVMDAIAGYCLVNDVSERDWQSNRGGSWDKGKGFDSFGPIGPWLVTTDEIANPHGLGMWLEVDGQRMQTGSTASMIFKIRQLVAYCSQFTRLLPGDIIATGTPAGVGMSMTPPRYLSGGETMRLGIDGLGQQTQHVVRGT